MLQELVAATAPIRQDAVLPLRELRGRLKQGPFAGIRARVLYAELAAERVAQMQLVELAVTLPEGPIDVDRAMVAQSNWALCLGEQSSSAEAGIVMSELKSLMRRA